MYKSASRPEMSRLLWTNSYLIAGIALGFYVSNLVSNNFDSPLSTCHDANVNKFERKYDTEYEPKGALQSQNNGPPAILVSNATPSKASSSVSRQLGKGSGKPIRPRYYSTELGIREKLFVGVFTSEEKIAEQALHLNRTVGHLVDKIKFFITAKYKMRSKFNLTGIVGFTDTRYKYRPFQVFKYIGDNFDYDYYFLTHDYTFINAHKLNDVLKRISVSNDVYLGNRVKESSYCDLDSGIIFSNSVLKAVREHLDWCVINAISDDHSENIGRCVHHSIGLSCQEVVQEQALATFKVKHFELRDHLVDLTKMAGFNMAVTVYPVLQSDHFHLLNAYFLKLRLIQIKENVEKMSEDLTEVWPPGQRANAKPATRFDLPHQYYFNMTHMFFPDDFTNVKPHADYDLRDIENVIEEVKSQVWNSQDAQHLQYRRLINGYRSFDLSRGLDYTVDLGFRDLATGKEVIKRFEVCKPLGKVEFVPVPYVTENSRVNIVLPVEEHEIPQVWEFLNGYTASILDRKEKTFLMLALLYGSDSSSRGADDVFGELKNYVTKISNKHRNDDVKMAWVSIRLPQMATPATIGSMPVLNFCIVDLALRKIGLDGLILMLDSRANITADFLNRVRMNTISNFQIYNPIPFRQYDPNISQCTQFDVSKNCGHFDKEEFRYVSFYGKDYVSARKRYQHKVPIIRVDGDIANAMRNEHSHNGNIFEMFVQHGIIQNGGDTRFERSDRIHCMRAIEMNLKVKFQSRQTSEVNRSNLFLGNQAQLARLLLVKSPQIPELQ